MLFLESSARLVLLLHAIGAGVLVGAATHHTLACRRYLTGRFDRARSERLYLAVTTVGFALTFVLGALLYPTYKVRVRAEYFDAPATVAAERTVRAEAAAKLLSPPLHEPLGDLSSVARLFDVKEHWVALGLFASLALVLLGWLAHPARPPGERRFALVYFGLSLFVCGAAWIGTIVGLVCASYRSVGGAS